MWQEMRGGREVRLKKLVGGGISGKWEVDPKDRWEMGG